MGLNPDCLRDVLICIEEHTGIRQICAFVDQGTKGQFSSLMAEKCEMPDYQKSLSKQYDNDELIYHVRYCAQDDLICLSGSSTPYLFLITDLTPKGHQFIEKIRDDKQWSAVKRALESVRDYSLSAIGAIAEGVTSAGISAYFSGLTHH